MAKNLAQRELAKQVAESCRQRGLRITIKDDDINLWEQGYAVPRPEIVVALAEVLEMSEADLRQRTGWIYVGDRISDFSKNEWRKFAHFTIERAFALARAFVLWATMGVGGWITLEIIKRFSGMYDGTISDFGKQVLTILTDADIAVTAIGFLSQVGLEWYYVIKDELDLRRQKE